jgi:hypothetical protein
MQKPARSKGVRGQRKTPVLRAGFCKIYFTNNSSAFHSEKGIIVLGR